MIRLILAPSLARRLTLALLAAFLLVGLVLIGKNFHEFKRDYQDNPELRKLGESLTRTLARTDDIEFAGRLIRLLGEQYNESRSIEDSVKLDPLLFQFYDRKRGRMIYASAVVERDLLPAQPTPVVSRQIQGREYWVYASDTPDRSFRLAEPKIKDLTVIALLLKGMSLDLLLSFPLVLLPVWFAVHRGLHPLRQLAQTLRARGPDDLSAVNVDLRYRELLPLLESFDGLLARLRYKVMQERAFVQDAAHEMRTPMAVIGAQAHVLALAESSDERQDAKQALDRAIARASHLSQQLLSLASLERGTKEVEIEADLPGLIQGILAEFAPAAIARDVELALEAPEQLRWKVKTESLLSILHNLIDNALRYGRKGGQVVVSLEPNERGIRLCVADDGPGIVLAERELVFERFYRGNGQDVAGTGLGLAIVKKAVLNLGGTVSLATGLNGLGVAFAIELPRES